MPVKKRFTASATLAGAAAGVLVVLFSHFEFSPLHYFELQLYDSNFPWFWQEEHPPPEIVIVSIDPASLARLGSWPWPRKLHADVIRAASRGGARVIHSDIAFFEPDRQTPENDQALADATREAGNVVYPTVAEAFGSGEEERVVWLHNLPVIADGAAGEGHPMIPFDIDGAVREVHLSVAAAGQEVWAISLEVLRVYLGVEKQNIRQLSGGTLSVGDIEIPARRTPTPATTLAEPFHNYAMRIGYAHKTGTIDRISAYKVIRGDVPEGYFEGRIVLYGFTAAGLGEEVFTPLSTMGGLEIQANIIDCLLRQRFLRRADFPLVASLVMLAALAASLFRQRYKPPLALKLLVCFIGGTVILYFVSFNSFGYWIEVMPIQTALLASFIGTAAVQRRSSAGARLDRAAPGELALPLAHAEGPASPESGTVTPVQHVVPGSVLARRYVLEHEVGSGGMGVVFLAQDRELNERVAIKVIRPELLRRDPAMVDRFKREIRLARRITHENVLRVYEFGDSDGTKFITMEYLEGINLKQLILEQAPLPLRVGVPIAQQICAGLAAAHAQGVIHRDIKPQNIVVGHNRQTKIMDFGIARPVDGTGLTASGVVLGTPEYMSPEARDDSRIDERSDIYSAGVVFHEMFTGRRPRKSGEDEELGTEIPESLKVIIHRCLRRNPADRFQRVAEVGLRLAALGP